MKIVSRECNIRSYVYKAHLTEAGKLSKITAGCRKWKTFADAQAHYTVSSAWTDDTVAASSTPRLRYAQRREARSLLENLERDTRKAQARIRARNRRRARR